MLQCTDPSLCLQSTKAASPPTPTNTLIINKTHINNHAQKCTLQNEPATVAFCSISHYKNCTTKKSGKYRDHKPAVEGDLLYTLFGIKTHFSHILGLLCYCILLLVMIVDLGFKIWEPLFLRANVTKYGSIPNVCNLCQHLSNETVKPNVSQGFVNQGAYLTLQRLLATTPDKKKKAVCLSICTPQKRSGIFFSTLMMTCMIENQW